MYTTMTILGYLFIGLLRGTFYLAKETMRYHNKNANPLDYDADCKIAILIVLLWPLFLFIDFTFMILRMAANLFKLKITYEK